MRIVIKVQLVDEDGVVLSEEPVAVKPNAKLGDVVPVFAQIFRTIQALYLKGKASFH